VRGIAQTAWCRGARGRNGIRPPKWSGPRPGGLALRLRGSWGTEVRGWPPAASVLTDSLGCAACTACESVSARAKRKTDMVCACGNINN
jgi:hypothetical protein